MSLCEKFLVAQSGGPTSAINATLCGVIEAAIANQIPILGAVHGIKGVMNEQFIPLNDIFSSKENRTLLKTTPAAYLGSCRMKLPDLDKDNALYEKIFHVLKQNEITCFLYIGGNDSMDTVWKLSDYAKAHQIDIRFIGIPKTVDNDLLGTDHTPGFGSAAKYVGATIREIARDSAVYAERSVTIVEIMGRNAGWLTAASCLARCSTSYAPHYIYLPEKPFSREQFIRDIEACPARNMIIAVSEGIQNEDGVYISAQEAQASDIFGHAQLSGACRVLSDIVDKHFHYKTRGIELSIPQRCSAHFASLTDLNESVRIGFASAEAALSGKTGIMFGFRRGKDYYSVDLVENPVCEVANKERKLPEQYINAVGNDVTPAFLDYVKPLIQGEPDFILENGLPKHIALEVF